MINANDTTVIINENEDNTKIQLQPMQLTKEEEQELREVFDLIDRDKGGSISKQELQQLLTTLSIQASQQEIDLMVREIDTNNDGEIQFDEFVAVMSKKVHTAYTPDEVKRAFKVFETAPGLMQIDALEKALCAHGNDRMGAQQIAELLSHIETDPGGYFNYIDVSSFDKH